MCVIFPSCNGHEGCIDAVVLLAVGAACAGVHSVDSASTCQHLAVLSSAGRCGALCFAKAQRAACGCTCMLTRLSYACRHCTVSTGDNEACHRAAATCSHMLVILVTRRLHRGDLVSVRCQQSRPEVECCLPCCVSWMVSGTAAAAHMAHSLPTSAALAAAHSALQTRGSLQMLFIRSHGPQHAGVARIAFARQGRPWKALSVLPPGVCAANRVGLRSRGCRWCEAAWHGMACLRARIYVYEPIGLSGLQQWLPVFVCFCCAVC